MAMRFRNDEGRWRSRVVTLVVIVLATGLTLWLQRSHRKPAVGLVVPVWGEVTVGSEPLEDAKISFIPDPDKGNTSPFVPTGRVRNGVYEVSTEGQTGAPPGWYRIILIPPTLDISRPPPALFDRRFSNPDRTPLSIQVVESEGDRSHDFRLPAP